MNTLPKTMAAAYITEFGSADAITVGSLPTQRPSKGEVLVRTEALAVNHVDIFVRSGAYPTSVSFPFVIGRDLVGTVVSAGPQVIGFEPGERVWSNSLGHDGRQGSFAELVVVPAERLYHLPTGVEPTQAAAVLHTAATAYIGLVREAGLVLGETLVVCGAAGGVGSSVVQLGAAAGARVIATARPDDAAWCRSCGASAVLDYGQSDLAEQIAAHAPEGVDVFWDNSGTHDLEHTLPLLARGGRIIAMAGLLATPVLPIGQLYLKDASIRGFIISNASVADLALAAKMTNYGLSRGILKARICAKLPMSEAAEAHRLQEKGARGRIIVLPSDS